MIKKYYISGTSSGIGRALALAILADENAHVVGISRRCTITHGRYQHITLDLSNTDELENFAFNFSGNEKEIALINNAGWVGEIAPVGKLTTAGIAHSFALNVSAPVALMNAFVAQTQSLKNARKIVVNISSGAAQYPVKSWSTYCASKAAINMATEVAAAENASTEFYAIAPGIVNTEMQADIRSANPENFPDLARFKNYFEDGELNTPENVAQKIIHLLNHPEQIPQNVFSLREIE